MNVQINQQLILSSLFNKSNKTTVSYDIILFFGCEVLGVQHFKAKISALLNKPSLIL